MGLNEDLHGSAAVTARRAKEKLIDSMRSNWHGVERIGRERARQISEEGWTLEHDDAENSEGELAEAASCYADLAAFQAMASKAGHSRGIKPDKRRPLGWPWTITRWKPSPDPIRNLEKAGALIAAEIDRLVRLKGWGE
jgi:hypothetical protein